MDSHLSKLMADLEAHKFELADLSNDIKATLNLGLTLRDDSGDPAMVPKFKARASQLTSTHDRFVSICSEAIRLAKLTETDIIELGQLRRETREYYYEALSLNIIESHETTQVLNLDNSTMSNNRRVAFGLPTINLPTFNGDINQWPTFKDTFLSLVHTNEDLDPIRKFHYLRSSLSGVALHAISSIPITELEYPQAWNLLLARYDSKRILAVNYLVKIFNFKPLSRNDLPSLENFISVVLKGAQSFRNLNLPDPSGFVLYTFALRLLDAQTRERFERSYGGQDTPPSFEDFSDFIHLQCRQLQTNALTSCTSNNNNLAKPQTKRHVLMSVGVGTEGKVCPVCQATHRIFDCNQFRLLSPQDRYLKIKTLKLCLNCLSAGHSCVKCPSQRGCKHCGQRHNSLLHFVNSADTSRFQQPKTIDNSSKKKNRFGNQSRGPTVASPSSPSDGAILSAAAMGQTDVLLGTALGRIRGQDGKFQLVRILVDCGSQRSFVTVECAKRLALPTCRNPYKLVVLGDRSISGGDHSMLCTLIPHTSNSPKLRTSAIIIDRICDNIPSCQLPRALQQRLSGYNLADPNFGEPGPIDFLLGADLFSDILTGPFVSLPNGFPTALETIFGIVLMGKMTLPKAHTFFISQIQEAQRVQDLLSKFWEIEEVPSIPQIAPDDVLCENHFARTHYRDEDGHYVVSLPFKQEPIILGDSRQGALHRFYRLEQRFAKDPQFGEAYSRVLAEHLEKGYFSEAKCPGKFYLPHHGVTKDSSSTKLRVVFDASFLTNHGSLNDNLLTGPKLQNDIKDVLLQFRIPRFVMTADIAQMYLQIGLSPNHRIYQHFFFRFDPTQAVTEYEMNRLSFGLSSAPFLALRVLKQLVIDEGSHFPRASETLKHGIYIDDVLTGANTIEEAKSLKFELIELLKKGGFELRKWSSNIKELINAPVDNQIAVPLDNLEDSTVKVLGMQWEPQDDCLSYHIRLKENVMTKRGILSTIARMYDPLGYLSPVLFKAKCVLQRLWELKTDWDEPIPEDLAKVWSSFFQNLSHLSTIRVPRWCIPSHKRVIVLGFADASSLGYAAVVYIRTETDIGKISTNLLFSKTRLAPLKTITIPRLELCAALLLVNTIRSLQNCFSQMDVTSTFLMTDSMTVLSWLTSPLHHLKVFVANRVSQILDLSKGSSWYHVRSEDNAADLPSRGTDSHHLADQSAWWQGPTWMRLPISEWPLTHTQNLPPCNELPEIKPLRSLFVYDGPASAEVIFERFSSYSKMIRILSHSFRFIQNIRTREKRLVGPLKLAELNDTTHTLIKLVQGYYFQEETKGKASSKLKSLSPFVDSRGVLRVGGRLSNAPIAYEAKHPILLPHQSRLTVLLVDHLHLSYLHAGPQLLHSLIRQRFWVTSSRRFVRTRVHKCLKCHRMRGTGIQPFMSDLPRSRFEQGRPFINVGVDFAGPFSIKASMRRKAPIDKAYISLFVCFGTKAVHIETVSQLSSDAFLACLDRFIARRGLPSRMYSDNATNFVGTHRRLRELYTWWKSDETLQRLEGYLNAREIEWSFIPPAAPNFGGLWEAGVKSLKYHLTRIVGQQPLTFEELSTVSIRIEAIMNSRPLHPLSPRPDDFHVLTPGHFLIGDTLTSIPQRDWTDRPAHLVTRWQFLQRCISDFWKRWRLDYLHCLQQRHKWNQKTSNIELDTLVLLKDSTSSPLLWPTGRVVEMHPGKDGVVRVVKIKTPTGEFLRPVSRLVPLFPE